MGKSKAMHKVDFLKVLPNEDDMWSLSRAKVKYDMARKVDVLDVGTAMG